MSYFQNGETTKMIHFKDGLALRSDDLKDLRDLFCKVWPTTYGTKPKETKSGKAPCKDKLSGRTFLHGKSPEATGHREAFIRLLKAIWPSDSYLQFFGLRALQNRPLFHSERFRLAIALCKYLWSGFYFTWQKKYEPGVISFDPVGVGNFIESTVS